MLVGGLSDIGPVVAVGDTILSDVGEGFGLSGVPAGVLVAPHATRTTPMTMLIHSFSFRCIVTTYGYTGL